MDLETRILAASMTEDKKQRDYWFQVANNYIDLLDWLCEKKFPEYDVSELLKEFEDYQDNLTENHYATK